MKEDHGGRRKTEGKLPAGPGREGEGGWNRAAGTEPSGWGKQDGWGGTRRMGGDEKDTERKNWAEDIVWSEKLRMRDAVGWERTDGEDDREMKRDGKSWMRNVMSVRADARRRWM